MKESNGAGGVRYPKAEELVGREYNCCFGPLRNQAIKVVEPLSGGRFRLEAEDGTRFRIDAERLARIFGDPSSRSCRCCPVEEISLAPAQPEARHAGRRQATPPRQEVVPAGETATEAQDESANEAPEAPTAASQTDAPAPEESTRNVGAHAPASVVFTGDSPQGLLFG